MDQREGAMDEREASLDEREARARQAREAMAH